LNCSRANRTPNIAALTVQKIPDGHIAKHLVQFHCLRRKKAGLPLRRLVEANIK